MSVTNRRHGPRDPQQVLIGVGLGLAAAALGVVYGAVHLAHWATGAPSPAARNPITLVSDLAHGVTSWTTTCTVLAATLTMLLIAATVGGLLLAGRTARPGGIDRAASHLGRGKELAPISRRGARKKAAGLNVEDFIGLPVGVTVSGGTTIYQDVEAVRVTVAGMRSFKTSAFVIKDILNSPGWCLTTSNRRDTTDATRDLRAALGQVWVFDPQQVAKEPPTWWWNPLSFIADPDTGRPDEARADYLGTLLYGTSRPADAKSDEYFGPEGAALVGGLLLAGAVAGLTLLDVYGWATHPNDDEPARILEHAGYALPAQAVRAVLDSPSKERSGIFGGVRRTLSFMRAQRIQEWVTDPGGRRPQFNPRAFVRGRNTLYSLSREGVGTAGPLVLALTVAVCEAAEELATVSGGRLQVPGTAILDEIANVCRWGDLPARASHYGGRGILIHALLQSWAQGVQLWGELGMRSFATASNLFVYGGGSREVSFLSELAQLVGSWRPTDQSLTTSRQGASTGLSVHTEQLLDVSDLSEMRLDRGLVFASGAPPTLIRKQPWMGGPRDAAIRASIAAHDPKAAATLSLVDREAAAWRTGAQPPVAGPAPLRSVEPDVPSAAQVRTDSPWQARQ